MQYNGKWILRYYVDNEVLVKADETYIRIGDFAQIKITHADHYDLYGELV